MDNKNLQITNHDFFIYRDSNNDIKVSVMLINNDIWLTQNLIAELFGVGRSTITEHINNILNSGELDENNTVGKTDIDNSKKPVKIYNLDMIIAVGYRVNSKKATNFRIWATKILKEYMIKGVVMDDERLKNPNYIFGEDYFEETLERIRNIRSSERRFYQKITDIYSSCSVDYDKDSEITKEFFKTVQNKLHYAITGNTAAEIIYNRVDSEKENMGLTNWKNSPDGPIYKYDVDIAKNYLNEKELKDLNRIVTMYLDYAELQAENHNAMTMKDWVEKLNAFLQFNGKEILHSAGKISASVAKELAYKEYDKFKVIIMDMYQKREMRKNKKMNEDTKSLPSTNINWYPGHMAKTKRQIIEDLKLIDIVVEILDARIPVSSQNPDIQEYIKNKSTVILLNKSDLSSSCENEKWVNKIQKEGKSAVLVNCNSGEGIKNAIAEIKKVYNNIKEQYKNKGRIGKSIRVMVLGIPNVGKSSFINRASKKVAAQVGNKPGVTRQKQWIRLEEGIELLDTPGVLWPKFGDEKVALNLAYTGTIKDDVLETIEVGFSLLKFLLKNNLNELIERYKLETEDVKQVLDDSNLDENEKALEILHKIGRKRGAVISGGDIDEEKTAKIILDDFRSGKIGKITLEKA